MNINEHSVCNSVLLRNHGSSKKVHLLNTTGRQGNILDNVRAQTGPGRVIRELRTKQQNLKGLFDNGLFELVF